MSTHARKHCCERLTEALASGCTDHDDPHDCPDRLVVYVDKFDEYGLAIHDGGTSYVTIQYCPWCGTQLPASKRDRWFEELEAMGIDDPTERGVPADFQTDAWWRSE